MKIEKKYLVIPVNKDAETRKICFFNQKGQMVMDLNFRPDHLSPTYMAYVDVSRFAGEELTFTVEPHTYVSVTQADEMVLEGLWEEDLRPFVHFTPMQGWINDPNGCIKYQGRYHLFFQHNPMGIEWGNMHWGHAVSDDLLHWEQKDEALFPDSMGAMYSGSAIEDKGNLTGVGADGTSPLLLFYTAAGNRTLMSKSDDYTQCLAYSLDGGESFIKYENNPIIPQVTEKNRDPKVIYSPELKKYLMALYMEGDEYGLLTSADLKNWSLLQRVTIEGESECPDVIRFEIEGEAYYVLSGASDKYVVGKFDNGRFIPLTPTQEMRCSKFSYAGQSFSGVDDGRKLKIIWNKVRIPDNRIGSQMGVPLEVDLIKNGDKFVLTYTPARELESLYLDSQIAENVEGEVTFPLKRAAYDISLDAKDFGQISLETFGHTMTVDKENNTLTCYKYSLPLKDRLEATEIRVIIDRCSAEVFTDGGSYHAVFANHYDYSRPYLRLICHGGRVDKIECTRLKGIH